MNKENKKVTYGDVYKPAGNFVIVSKEVYKLLDKVLNRKNENTK